MSRSKLNKLMSRASTLALAAVAGVLGTGGATGTAEAGTTVNTPGSNPHVYNTSNTDFVFIGTGVTLEAGPQGNSFTNDPGIIIQENTGTAVAIDSSTLLGKFVNNGTIISDNTDAVAILNSSVLTQSFVNAGVIDGSSDGISIYGSTIQAGLTNSGTITGASGTGIDIYNNSISAKSFAGGLTNSGTIQGGSGVALGGTQPLNFSGGIQNSGRITGDSGDAIFMGKSVVYTGGINNTSTGKILSNNADGIEIQASSFAGGITNAGTIASEFGQSGTNQAILITSDVVTFSGGITNSGLISATTTSGSTARGIEISADTFNGGIVNTSTGDIVAQSDAILLTSVDGTFNGGVNNAGTIDSATGNGIEIDYETFNGGVVNSGTIISQSSAIYVSSDVDNFTGGISNSGLVESTNNDGIEVNADSFAGGIQNSGTVIASSTGIYVTSDVTSFTGGLVNSGLIRTTDSGDGIGVYAASFTGGLTNSGTIEADSDDGIQVGSDTGESFAGGLTNSGQIEADSIGINIDLDDFTGGLTNSGIIDAGTSGLYIEADTFAGGVRNSGTILADRGIDIDVDDTFAGGVTNTGLVSADAGFGIQITGPDTFDGGFLNSGTINSTGVSGPTPIFANGVDIDVATFNGGFTNAGLIDSSGGALLDGDVGVAIEADVFNGGFTNSGTILADPTDDVIPSIVGSSAAVVLNVDVLDGGVTNSGLIDAEDGMGVYFYGTTFHDGINNSGTINSTDTGVAVIASSFDGGIVNSGLIDSTSSTGVRVEVSGNFAGGLTNTGTIVAADDAIHMDVGVTFSGGITNSGRLEAGDDGIRTEGSSFQGGIHNLLAGVILADETGIQVDNDTFGGGITNAGFIDAGDRGIDVDVQNFTNGVSNSGTINATVTGVEIDGTNFSGGVQNSGVVEGGEGDGFNIDVTTFNDGFRNSGTITADDDGVYLNGTTFNGGLTNSGTISSGSEAILIDTDTFNGGINNSGRLAGDTGLEVNSDNFNGGFINTGHIDGASYGAYFSVTTWANGNLSNSGTIEGGANSGLYVGATTFAGNIVNSGTIQSGGISAVYISAGNHTGGITNSGLIDGETQGLDISSTTMTGNLVNSGTIVTNEGEAVYISGTTINGFISNSGLIQSNTSSGIYFSSGRAASGIFNSGTIIAGDGGYAINVSNADSGHTITQTAGVMQGDLELQNGYDDTVNFNGGSFEGRIYGYTSDDVVNVGAGSGSFAFLSGEIDGLDQFNVNSGTAVMGSSAVGTNGDGVDTTDDGIDFINVNGGTLYLDDDTQLRANDTYDQDSDAEVQFLLSRDTDDNTFAGEIDADTANIDGTITGVIDLEAFALGAGTTNFFTYNNVIEANSLNGTFDNVGVLNDLIFFDLQVEYDGDDTVDLVLERLSFSEVLAEASQSSNQQEVGAVLETIFNAGGFDPDFAAAFEDLLGSSSFDEALAVYDQLLGAEHAQAALGMFNSMGQFQGFLGERMDVLHNGMGTAQWAMFGQPGTQVAAAETVLADASPTPGMGGGSMVTTRSGNTLSMFGGVSGNWSSVEGDTNGPGFDQDTFGLNAGVDYAFSSETLVGLGGSYQSSELEFDSNNSGDVDTFAVGLFGTFGLGGGYLDANANVGFHDVSMSRLTPAPDYASAEYSATSWSLSGELGTVIPVGRAYVAPMLSMTYVGVSVDSFTETGSDFALAVDSAETDSFATVLGARAGDYFKVGKATVNLQGNLGWRHEFGDEQSSFSAAFLEEPALLFNVDSSKIASDSATFGVGTTVSLSTRMEVFVNYDGVWNAEADSHNASLGVRSTW